VNRLDSKVAVITAGASAQSQSTAGLFASEGAVVYVADEDADACRDAVLAIRQQGLVALSHHLEITSELSWQHLVADVLSDRGRLDVLVNGATATSTGHVEDVTVQQWERAMNMTVRGAFLGAKTVIPHMRSRGAGVIVNMSTIAAITAPSGTSELHAAAMGALRILTKDISAAYAMHGIRCNSVHTGLIDNTLWGGDTVDDERLEDLLSITPMRRSGLSAEVAYGVLYLATVESSYVTGIELVIDGGIAAF
jgi:NAD(P)-dependent dehydrogenase (short-subunit alcohol dehydrogenase family)